MQVDAPYLRSKSRKALLLLLCLGFLFLLYVSVSSINSPTNDGDDIHTTLREKDVELDHCKCMLLKERKVKSKTVKELSVLDRKLNQCYPKETKEVVGKRKPSHRLPIIYVVTPTYARPTQKAELTRLSHTLLHIPNLHWLVVEDASTKSNLVSNFLAKCGLQFTHLNISSPAGSKLANNMPNPLRSRGVLQRNLALEWLRNKSQSRQLEGVVYFADDDNTYDLQLFQEMRHTNKVSVWPVGLLAGLRYERPVVANGRVVGWFTAWKPERPFPVDMAGFAVNLQYLIDNPGASFKLQAPRGYVESSFLASLNLTLQDLQPKAGNCTKVLVWHTKTEPPDLAFEKKLAKSGKVQSDPNIEV